LLADTVRMACQRMQPSDLTALSDCVAQAALMPAKPCWERKAVVHAEAIGMLGDATGDSALVRLVGLAVGWTYDLAVAAGPAADWIIRNSRNRLLRHLRAGDSDAAGKEIEQHLRVLRLMERLSPMGNGGRASAVSHSALRVQARRQSRKPVIQQMPRTPGSGDGEGMSTHDSPVVLEPAAQTFVEATAKPPFLFDLPIAQGRKTVDSAQDGDFPEPAAGKQHLSIPGGPTGEVPITVYRPKGEVGTLPVVLYTHGAGWVFGDEHTHDRLVRELTARAEAATVFTNYSLSPEAKYPVAIEQIYTAPEWIANDGAAHGLDPNRIAVAGDSVGGNMTAAITIMAKQRGGPRVGGQLLYYPVTDAAFDTPSYHQFATGYWLRRDAMQWFWDQYTTDPAQRAEITASPLRAATEDLRGLPQALGQADVLRDEGEAYAAKLRDAGVEVTSVRYNGTIHDFVMLNALRDTHAAKAATAQGGDFLKLRRPATRGGRAAGQGGEVAGGVQVPAKDQPAVLAPVGALGQAQLGFHRTAPHRPDQRDPAQRCGAAELLRTACRVDAEVHEPEPDRHGGESSSRRRSTTTNSRSTTLWRRTNPQCLRWGPTFWRTSRDLVETLGRDVTTDWVSRDDVRAKIRSTIKRLLAKWGYPPDQQQNATELVLRQMETFAEEWSPEAGR
jgi:acetyl esterase